MPDRAIIFDDGTMIEGKAGYAEGFLWCWFSGFTMQEVCGMFLDQSKTRKISFAYGGTQDDYQGFTDCVMVKVDIDGVYSVCMRRAV